nr:MAG: hypothetical protein [Picornavirales sp.]
MNQILLLTLPQKIVDFMKCCMDTVFSRQSDYEKESDFMDLIGPSAQLLSLGVVAATSSSNSQLVTKVIKAGNIARTFTNVKSMTDVVKVSLETSKSTLFTAVTGMPPELADSFENISPLAEWLEMVNETIDDADWMAHYIDDPRNEEIIQDLIKQGETLHNTVLKDFKGESKKFAQTIKNSLERMRKLLTSFKLALTGNRTRQLPVSVLFYGGANIGKTYISNCLANDLLSLQPAEYRARFKTPDQILYTQPQNSDYFSGYNGQFAYMQDELFQVKTQEDNAKAVANVFQLIQETSAPLNQAELELKGRIHFSSKLVLFTTNVTNFRHIPVQNSDALVRRFHFTVTPVVKQQFRTNTGMLDLAVWEQHCVENNLDSSQPDYAVFCTKFNANPNEPQMFYTYSQLVRVLNHQIEINRVRHVTTTVNREARMANRFNILNDQVNMDEIPGEHGLNFWRQADDIEVDDLAFPPPPLN